MSELCDLRERFARVAALGDVPAHRDEYGDGPAVALDHGVLALLRGGVDIGPQTVANGLHARGHDLLTCSHGSSVQTSQVCTYFPTAYPRQDCRESCRVLVNERTETR